MKETVSPMRLRTNAKVNLFLRVRGLRPDGYHEVETILHSVGLSDEMVIERTTSGTIEIEMQAAQDGSFDFPAPEDNLVHQVARHFIDTGAGNEGVRVRIMKRIPIGAGLGGGSGNAAGAVVALAELWGLGLDRRALLDVAKLIGVDVPYCIAGGTALATGRGDDLTALPVVSEMWFVLGISHRPLYTGEVYKAFDGLEAGDDVPSAPMCFALGAGDVDGVAELLHNDLERAAFLLRPELAAKKRVLQEAGSLGVALSGSGPTLFAVARDRDHAHTIAGRVAGQFEQVAAAPTRLECLERLDGGPYPLP
ncbi:MAG: 4-(cytidine 5'-diphospho)-2-C-methyl-D-erythritol kinase [Actinomycetota bacterium]